MANLWYEWVGLVQRHFTFISETQPKQRQLKYERIWKERRVTVVDRGQGWTQGYMGELLGKGCGWKITENLLRKLHMEKRAAAEFWGRTRNMWVPKSRVSFLLISPCRLWARAARCCSTSTTGWDASCKMVVSSLAPSRLSTSIWIWSSVTAMNSGRSSKEWAVRGGIWMGDRLGGWAKWQVVM